MFGVSFTILQMSSVTHTVTMIGSRGDSNGVFTPPEIPVNPGAGKVAISTPYWHAVELLADGRGVLVPFRDAKAIAREVIGWLHDETRRHAIFADDGFVNNSNWLRS